MTNLPTLTQFLQTHQRLPKLGDPIPPWRYHGFLLPYIIDLHRCLPDFPDRWGYYARTISVGHLLDEPIPSLTFTPTPDPTVLRDVDHVIRAASPHLHPHEAFRLFVQWVAWGLHVAPAPPPLPEAHHQAWYQSVDLGAWLVHPHDYLGAILAEQVRPGANPTSFVPTPLRWAD